MARAILKENCFYSFKSKCAYWLKSGQFFKCLYTINKYIKKMT